ncbi:flagellar hook-length control protein FliK [Anaerocolumna sp. MB42-C2]|uniref:flagellar hook-length control protein FliK n=1 Tax=Anaerocolumna sp. MB42-C2 TaxID=3070997 RepID=UPI0027E128E2|nr:flagellar hook-length control protein FliK [Anaerocolumna sp. MB42-C2]WMJ88446.1 flagellar hook-length control protein FliK [Anaerocolumna sp. MB42-C2]
MTPQSIKAQTVNLFSDLKAGNTSSVAKSSGKNFSSIMDSNLKSQGTDKNEKSTVNDKADNSKGNTKTPDTDNKTVTRQDTVVDTKTVNNNAQATGKKVNNEKPDKLQTEESAENNTESAGYMEIIQNILSMLQNTVQTSLGINEDELNKAMEDLGFTTMDLFDPDKLKQLVLQINGVDDVSDILTDENLADTINQLLQAVEDLKENPDLPISKEELSDIISRFQKDQLTDTPAQAAELKTMPEIKDPEISNVTDDKQKDINFEIHNFTDKNADTDSNQSFSKDSDQKKSEVKTQSPIETFIQNLAVKGNDNGLSFTEQIANVRQMQDITRQIVEQIKIFIKPEQTSMEIQLNPENLGKINLSVVAKDGIMTAHFTAQNELAKEAIESQMQVLKDNLNNQGLKVESIEVTVSDFSFDQSSQTPGESEKGKQNHSENHELNAAEADQLMNANENETQDNGSMNQTGSSIDYTA